MFAGGVSFNGLRLGPEGPVLPFSGSPIPSAMLGACWPGFWGLTEVCKGSRNACVARFLFAISRLASTIVVAVGMRLDGTTKRGPWLYSA